jgi:hypothetical protein
MVMELIATTAVAAVFAAVAKGPAGGELRRETDQLTRPNLGKH